MLCFEIFPGINRTPVNMLKFVEKSGWTAIFFQADDRNDWKKAGNYLSEYAGYRQ